MISAAHDLSEGGLAQALVEMCLAGQTGARIVLPEGVDPFVWLFSELTARVVVAVPRTEELRFTEMCTVRRQPLSIAETRWSSEWFGIPHAQTASYCAWRVCHVVGSSRSAVLPKMRPAACWPPPARVRGREEDGEVSLGSRLRRTDCADHLRRPAVHPGCALRCRDASTTRRSKSGRMSAISCATKLPIEKPSRSTRSKLHCLEEGDRVVRHRLDGVRRRTGRAADADVVEGDHAPPRGKLVDQRGIPVVEVAAEVLQQHERHLALTEVAVGVLDPVRGRNSFRRGIGVAGLGRRLFARGCHERSFRYPPLTQSTTRRP